MQLDKHEYLSTLNARGNNNLFNANEMMSKVKLRYGTLPKQHQIISGQRNSWTH